LQKKVGSKKYIKTESTKLHTHPARRPVGSALTTKGELGVAL